MAAATMKEKVSRQHPNPFPGREIILKHRPLVLLLLRRDFRNEDAIVGPVLLVALTLALEHNVRRRPRRDEILRL